MANTAWGLLQLGKGYYVTFALCHRNSVYRLSVVCRLSVTLVHPTHGSELFVNIFLNVSA